MQYNTAIKKHFNMPERPVTMINLFLHPILIAAAVIPAVLLMIRVYRSDRLEREPAGLLLGLVLMGFLATVLALIVERIGETILAFFFDETSLLYRLLLCFVVVGCSEEGAKLLLLKWRTWRSPSFDCQFDGVVYAVFVSLGFALWENIGYVLMYGLGTALLRAVTAVPGHACFGVFMGMWYSTARRYANVGLTEQSKTYLRRAFYIPVLLHGCYDSIAMSDRQGFGLIFLAFVAGLFIAANILLKNLSREDRYF